MKRLLSIICLSFLLVSCSKTLKVDVPEETKPEVKTTNYSDALLKFGQLTRLFNAPMVVQCKDVVDKTGTSASTGGEIPFDITEMVRSSVNRIGGLVEFVPFDPVYVQQQMAMGQFNAQNLKTPDVVISAAITEFDRSLEVKGDSADFGGDFGAGGGVSVDAGYSSRSSVSSITIDMNLQDFQTMSFIPQVQAINTIKVYKAAKDADIGFSIFGPAFGIKGSVKKVQGRHAAFRVLVEMGVLQLLGRYASLPYWKCIGSDKIDPVVIERRRNLFEIQDEPNKVWMIQQLLTLYGIKGLELNGVVDERTQYAMQEVAKTLGVEPGITFDFYKKLFVSLPLFDEPPILNLEQINAAISELPPPAPVAQTEESQSASQEENAATNQESAQDSTESKLKQYLRYMREGKKAFSANKYPEAREYFVNAINTGVVTDPDCFVYLAYTDQALENNDELEQILKMGIELFPDEVRLYKLLIKHYIAIDKQSEASNLLEQALKIAPDDDELVFFKSYVQ